MGGETEKNISGWTIDTLKEYLESRIAASEEALHIARTELERRLEGLNELRESVEKDRSQFVKGDVYHPAHEELRRQRVADNEKAIALAGQVGENTKDIASMKSSQMWLTRLVAAALISALLAYVLKLLGH